LKEKKKKKKECNSFVVFYRGLVGYRSVFSSDTRGTVFMHRAFLSMHVLLKIFVHVVLEILMSLLTFIFLHTHNLVSCHWVIISGGNFYL
jgi:hypothetical protein